MVSVNKDLIYTIDDDTRNLSKTSDVKVLSGAFTRVTANTSIKFIADNGLVVPNITATERDSIASPEDGAIIYNTTDSQFEFYQESIWVPLQPFDYQYIESLNQIITNQDFATNPVTKFDQNLILEAGDYEVKIHFEVDCSSISRSIEAGLYVNSSLVGQTFRQNPVSSSNTYYITKIFRQTFTAGSHSFKLNFGRSSGGGSAVVSVANVTLVVERKL